MGVEAEGGREELALAVPLAGGCTDASQLEGRPRSSASLLSLCSARSIMHIHCHGAHGLACPETACCGCH